MGKDKRLNPGRLMIAWGCLIASCILTVGCGTLGESQEAADPPPYIVKATLDKSVYRPGEAAIVTVEVINNTNDTRMARSLDADSVEFHYKLYGTSESVKRDPVVSIYERQEMGKIEQFAPGASLKRTFVHTTLSEYEGVDTLQVHYDPSSPFDKTPQLVCYSKVITYRVEGEPLFYRDNDGLIHQSDAEALAKAAAPMRAMSVESIPIIDDMGFRKYHVNVKMAPNVDGSENIYSCYIDPYFGRVWREAKRPFVRKEKKEDDPRKQTREDRDSDKPRNRFSEEN